MWHCFLWCKPMNDRAVWRGLQHCRLVESDLRSRGIACSQVLLWSFILLSSCASASATNGGEAGYLLRETVSVCVCPTTRVLMASFSFCLVGQIKRVALAARVFQNHQPEARPNAAAAAGHRLEGSGGQLLNICQKLT